MSQGEPEYAWSRLYDARKEVARRFGDHFDLPLARKAEEVVGRTLEGGERVLDVGAHRRQFREKVGAYLPGLSYFSLDRDRSLPHDYHDLADVKETFDAVYLFEILEHQPLGDLTRFLEAVARVVRPGGWLFATTPSVFCPGQFLRDATHVTPLAHDELGGLLTLAGFRVEQLLRTYNASWNRHVLHVHLAGWLHRFLRVDYAPAQAVTLDR